MTDKQLIIQLLNCYHLSDKELEQAKEVIKRLSNRIVNRESK